MRLVLSDNVHPANMVNSDLMVSESMCANKRLATDPPAEWPVKAREHELRAGFSSSNVRTRAATGLTIFRATERKPEWHMLPGSSCSAISNELQEIVKSYETALENSLATKAPS